MRYLLLLLFLTGCDPHRDIDEKMVDTYKESIRKMEAIFARGAYSHWIECKDDLKDCKGECKDDFREDDDMSEYRSCLSSCLEQAKDCSGV